MLIFKSGDILKAEENIICHQVNSKGIMGGGLALQIANSYPRLYKAYEYYCSLHDYDYKKLKAQVHKVKVADNKMIMNCFTQKDGCETDYGAIEQCFKYILEYAKKNNLTIAVPYKYGCGIANGDWKVVKHIFENLSKMYQMDINIYKLEVNHE